MAPTAEPGAYLVAATLRVAGSSGVKTQPTRVKILLQPFVRFESIPNGRIFWSMAPTAERGAYLVAATLRVAGSSGVKTQPTRHELLSGSPVRHEPIRDWLSILVDGSHGGA